jgi:uncharacterized repeat protein (TIGR01451 family)
MTVNLRLTQRWLSLVTITVLLATFFSSAPPALVQAQTNTPAQAEALPMEAKTTSFNAEGRTESQDQSQEHAGAAADKPATEVDQSTDLPTPSAETESPLSTQTVQGTVAISISVQPEVRHSQYITYAFSYKNNGSTATTSLSLDTIWNNFRHTEDWGAWQYCPAPTTEVTGCGFIKASAFGPTITAGGNIPDGVRYNIASLAPGQSGGFKIQLFISKLAFPTSLPGGSEVRRPAASGKIYVNGETSPSSELTVTSLIVGPVLRISKSRVPDVVLYPLQTAPFTITVGNAIGSGDTVGGQLRADARPATNVIVRETFPVGSELVSAEGNYTRSGNTITWVIPVLNPRDFRTFKLVFKKLDGIGCGELTNFAYDVTSNEIPFDGTSRITLSGPGVGYPVARPLVIRAVFTNPGAVVYGNETTISIVVQSFWEQPITGANLQFKLPANATYLAGSGTPPPVSEPPPGQFGSTLNWTFNMPAAPSRTVGVEKTFNLRVRSGYFDTDDTNSGVVTVTPPAGSNIPNACVQPTGMRLSLLPRLKISMGSDAPAETMYNGNSYFVKRGQNFPYVLHLVNNSSQAMVVDKVWITMPTEYGANFSYVANSSTVNGTAKVPNTIVNGPLGKLEWLNVPVAANSQTIIRYSLTVQGYDYTQYCSFVYATLAQENVERESPVICVKINPQVELHKTVNKTKASPGEEVIFTISLTNREATPYMLGLVDPLDRVEWVSQISGYGTPTYDPGLNTVTWPLVSVAPNQTISASFRVRMPGSSTSCNPSIHRNEAVFFNETFPRIYQIPPVEVFVELTCRQIAFGQGVERSPVSLGDKFSYTVWINNLDTVDPTNTVVITDVLPFGFTYAGSDPTSPIVFTPTQTIDSSSGRVQLNWSVPPIPARAGVSMKFIARSGKSIGIYENWLSVAAAGGINRCEGQCEPRIYKNISSTYSIGQVNVQPLITIEPSISPTGCVVPGNTVNYKLTILNTNMHSYPYTTMVLTLPLGLQYVSPVGPSPAPQTSTTDDGATILTWGVHVPKKPNDAFGAQVVVEVTLKVGNVWGKLNTDLDAISASGIIPRKDGSGDTTVKLCPGQPSLAKTMVQKVPRIGDQLIYQLSVANPLTDRAVTATVEDILPSNISFVGMVSGPAPTQSGNKLTWNLSIPASTAQNSSVVILKFATRVNSGVVFQKYTNTATITQSSYAFSTTVNGVAINTATFTIGKSIYLPLTRK